MGSNWTPRNEYETVYVEVEAPFKMLLPLPASKFYRGKNTEMALCNQPTTAEIGKVVLV